MWDRAVDVLLQQGLAGVVIMALAFLAWRQMRWIADLQEKRLLERETLITALLRNTDAMEEVAKATDANNRAIEANTRLLQMKGLTG